jgi:hypothetical protein
MALPNSEKITSQIAMLPDAALKQMAMMHKSDPYVLPLIISEDGRRKQMRQAAQAQMARMPQPRVADAAVDQMGNVDAMGNVTGFARGGHVLPENQGIGQLPAPNMQRMADGGIAGYGDDQEQGMATGGMGGMFNFAQQSEPVMRMSGGGMPGYAKGGLTDKQEFAMQYKDLADKVGKELGVDPGIIISQWGLETAWGKKQVGQYNLGNIKDVTGKGPTAYDKMEKSKSSYKAYESPEAFAADYASLIKRNFPKAVGAGSDVGVFTAGLQSGEKGAYATDPNYRKSLANTFNALSNVIPSAQAAEPPKATSTQPEVLTDKERAALEQPAFMTPSSGKGRKEGKLSEVIKSGEAPRQMALGVGDLPYNLAGAPMDIGYAVSKAFGNKGPAPALGSEHLKQLGTKYLGREADSTDPTLRGFRTAGELGSMVVDPFSATRKVAQTAEGLEALALAQRAKTAEAEAKVATPVGMRLEPPRTEPPVMVADAQGRVMPADTRARVQQALADEAAVGTEAAKAAQLEKQAAAYPGSMQRAEMERLAGTSDKVRGTALAAEAGDLAESGIKTLTKTEAPAERPEVGESVSGTYDTTVPKPSDLIEATKEATPAKDRKGFDNEDLLMLGLNLMANKSPNFMTALGESGIQTLSAKKEREKRETDLEYKDIMKKYYGSLGEKAGAETKNLEAGTKYNAAARQHAMDNISREMQKWYSTLGGMNPNPQEEEAKRNSLVRQYFPLAGLEVPSTIASTAGVAIPQGVKVTRG